MSMTRRQLLKNSAATAAISLALPPWLSKMVWADGGALSSNASQFSDRILIVVQLSGGNDGINTVIPYSSAEYAKKIDQLSVFPIPRCCTSTKISASILRCRASRTCGTRSSSPLSRV